jgi:cardiolipin synthase
VSLLALAVLVSLFPVLVISPLVITLVWFGFALLARAFRLHGRVRRSRRRRREESEELPAAE